jgi:hypothetical protein
MSNEEQFERAQMMSRAGRNRGIAQAEEDLAAGRILNPESYHENGNFRLSYFVAYAETSGLWER